MVNGGLHLEANKRLTLVGMTGSGKTYFARPFVSGVSRLVVLDPKGEIALERDKWGLVDWEDRNGYRRLARGGNARVLAPAPVTDKDWEGVLWKVYELGNVVCYIDELYGVGPSQGSAGLRALYTRGRTRGIGVIGCTQRPRWVPLYVFSEANAILLFRLQLFEDRRHMAQIIGPEAEPERKGHSFLLYNADTGETTVYPGGIKVLRSGGTNGGLTSTLDREGEAVV